MRLTQPQPRPTAVLIDKLDAGGFSTRGAQPNPWRSKARSSRRTLLRRPSSATAGRADRGSPHGPRSSRVDVRPTAQVNSNITLLHSAKNTTVTCIFVTIHTTHSIMVAKMKLFLDGLRDDDRERGRLVCAQEFQRRPMRATSDCSPVTQLSRAPQDALEVMKLARARSLVLAGGRKRIRIVNCASCSNKENDRLAHA